MSRQKISTFCNNAGDAKGSGAVGGAKLTRSFAANNAGGRIAITQGMQVARRVMTDDEDDRDADDKYPASPTMTMITIIVASPAFPTVDHDQHDADDKYHLRIPCISNDDDDKYIVALKKS